jgi:hypothetical protein
MIFFVITIMVIFILLIYQRKKARHQQQISDMNKRFSEELLKSQLEIQEETFNGISQEIHDNVGQTLSLAKVQVNMMDHQGEFNRELLQELRESISLALSDLKDMAKGMSSERIKLLDIVELINGELQRIKRTGMLLTVLEAEGTVKELPYREKLILFRIVQESLQNIIRHARASEVIVRVTTGIDYLSITVRDDGIGFDPAAKTRSGAGLGLQNIINRTELLKGSASITSAPGAGTAITIGIPL